MNTLAQMLGLGPRERGRDFRERRAKQQAKATAESKRRRFEFRGKRINAASRSEARAEFKKMFGLRRLPAGESPVELK